MIVSMKDKKTILFFVSPFNKWMYLSSYALKMLLSFLQLFFVLTPLLSRCGDPPKKYFHRQHL